MYDSAKEKKAINERKVKEIAEKISTPEGRMRLLVDTWFPLDLYRIAGETEDQRYARRYAELVDREEMYRKEYEDNGKS